MNFITDLIAVSIYAITFLIGTAFLACSLFLRLVNIFLCGLVLYVFCHFIYENYFLAFFVNPIIALMYS